MKPRPSLPFLFTFLLLILASHPVGGEQMTPELRHTLHASEESRFIRMAQNFFVFYDPSTTMAVPYKNTGLTRIEAEKKILRESNASLPELNWQAGLYPHWKGELWLPASPMAFKPYYRLQLYKKADFAAAIEQLPIRSQSPPMLQTGLMKLEHLLGLPGRTEVFLFSDGKHSTFKELEPHPLTQAKKLAAKFDVCFNIVSSASGAKDKKLLDDIAAVNSCSQVLDFDTVYNRPEHLFGKLYMDTRANGFNNILFDFDKSNIKPQFAAELDKLGRLLQANPQFYAVLSGFTDSLGSEAYNIKLSQRRAESVRNYLHTKFGINRENMLMYWYGYANPVASNETAEGRQQNRRVTIVLRGKE